MNTPKNQNFKNTQYLKTPQSSRKMLHFSGNSEIYLQIFKHAINL